MYRLFVDEVGHGDFSGCELPGEQYLGLTGVIMDVGYEQGDFAVRMNRLKREIFQTENVILHRREIMNRVPPPFDRLNCNATRATFDQGCMRLVENSNYTVLTVIIDKAEHLRRYTVWRFQPYHYCMTCLLERYARWLSRRNLVGDVMFESRDKKQNMKLAKAYRRLYKRGTEQVKDHVFQKSFTSRELKIQNKAANVAGLQLADLIASPLCRDLICRNVKVEMKAGFGKRIVDIVRGSKYDRCGWNGKIEGWGTKWLP
jgi:Protein of unknown function (DUF3800)